jgi:hypothetical protein
VIPLPKKPRGSEIQERLTPNGLTLQWRFPPDDGSRVPTAAFLGFFFVLWAGGLIGGVLALVTEFHLMLLPWLPLWSLAGVLFGRIFWLLLQPPRPECIFLREDVMRYDPGTTAVIGTSWGRGITMGPQPYPMGFDYYRELFRRREPVRVNRSEVVGFRINGIGKRQRLVFERGAETIAIGSHLIEPDRIWLQTVLEAWRRGESVPDSRLSQRW